MSLPANARIEVACPPGTSTKARGDLLERVSADLLRIQQYEVTEQLRITGSELDLLCVHKVSRRQIYVECKAHRDPLSANVLKNIAGEVTLKNHTEGWLISAGPLGKDAEGVRFEWEQKPSSQSCQLQIYGPLRVLAALIDAGLIADPPSAAAVEQAQLDGPDQLGQWVLLITPFGRFWCVTQIVSGVAASVIVFHAQTGAPVSDLELLGRLQGTDTTLASYPFIGGPCWPGSFYPSELPSVIECVCDPQDRPRT